MRLCPWSLALASSVPVLGLERFCPRKGCPWPWPRIFFVSLALALASSLVSSTPPLPANIIFFFRIRLNRFQCFLFDTTYDQRISGFILCEDAKKKKKKHFLNTISKRARFSGCQKNFFRQNYLTIIWGVPIPQNPQMDPNKNQFFRWLKLGCYMFDIKTQQRDKYLDIVLGYPPNGHPKHQFFQLLNIVCQCLLLSVDI